MCRKLRRKRTGTDGAGSEKFNREPCRPRDDIEEDYDEDEDNLFPDFPTLLPWREIDCEDDDDDEVNSDMLQQLAAEKESEDLQKETNSTEIPSLTDAASSLEQKFLHFVQGVITDLVTELKDIEITDDVITELQETEERTEPVATA
jgi:hypothetical protein